jgi:hypothetical protein
MNVVAVSIPFTADALHRAGMLPIGHIVDEPSDLLRAVEHMISQHGTATAAGRNA